MASMKARRNVCCEDAPGRNLQHHKRRVLNSQGETDPSEGAHEEERLLRRRLI
jgi:hypothetical protein